MSPTLPGRLGDPNMQLRDDPRADPRMLAAMAPAGLDVAPPEGPAGPDSPLEEILEANLVAEEGFEMLGGVLSANTPPPTPYQRPV